MGFDVTDFLLGIPEFSMTITYLMLFQTVISSLRVVLRGLRLVLFSFFCSIVRSSFIKKTNEKGIGLNGISVIDK